jgi:hypothetical protein
LNLNSSQKCYQSVSTYMKKGKKKAFLNNWQLSCCFTVHFSLICHATNKNVPIHAEICLTVLATSKWSIRYTAKC